MSLSHTIAFPNCHGMIENPSGYVLALYIYTSASSRWEELGRAQDHLNNVVYCCMSWVSSSTSLATETLCGQVNNLGPAVATFIWMSEGVP